MCKSLQAPINYFVIYIFNEFYKQNFSILRFYQVLLKNEAGFINFIRAGD